MTSGDTVAPTDGHIANSVAAPPIILTGEFIAFQGYYALTRSAAKSRIYSKLTDYVC